MRALAGLIVALATAAAHAQSADRAADEAAIRGVIQAFLDTREANDAAALGAQPQPRACFQCFPVRRISHAAIVRTSQAAPKNPVRSRELALDALVTFDAK